MKVTQFAKAALAGLLLSTATISDASAQSLDFSGAPAVQDLVFYGFLGASLVDFGSGSTENAITFGAGLMMSTALYSMPGLLFGVEVDNTSFTGSGAGWGIQRIRAVVATSLVADSLFNATVSAMAGIGRISNPSGSSESGLSLGLRLALSLPAGPSSSLPRGLENASLFIQHDRNNTGGYWGTNTTSGGVMFQW